MGIEKRTLTRFIFYLLFICTVAVSPAQAKYGGGSGTVDDPYLIYDAEQLNAIGTDVNDWGKCFKLMADIDLSGIVFNPIGTGEFSVPFHGIFDGGGYVISNLTNTRGLFGYVTGTETIVRNVGLLNPEVHFESTTTSGGIGSLIGFLKEGVVTGCWCSGGSIIGDWKTGGLVGHNLNGIISDCYSLTSVADYSDFMAPDYVGGLVGSNGGYILNCYSAGQVYEQQTGATAGGLIGKNSGTVLNSFWDTQTSGQPSSDGGMGKTTAEMQDMNTFISAGWDFIGESGNGSGDIWSAPVTAGYPILWWQLPENELPALPGFSGGNGEPNTPYLISTAADLNKIGQNPRLMKAHFRLTSDINLTDVNLFPIGSAMNPFSGVFDGNGHAISHFDCTSSSPREIGFIKYAEAGSAEIRQLTLSEPNINVPATDRVGALVGWLRNGSINNCRAEAGSIIGDKYVGGLVGYNYAGNIQNSYSEGTVTGYMYTGGLVGGNLYSGNISNCESSGNVSGPGLAGGLAGVNVLSDISYCHSSGNVIAEGGYGGGLTGDNNTRGIIFRSYSTGNVTANLYSYVGGLTGQNKGTISESYSSATVSVTAEVDSIGGLAGFNNRGDIINCYSSGTVTGGKKTGGLVGNTLEGSIITSYSTSPVSGDANVGGFAGVNDSAAIKDCFWDVNSTGQTSSAGGTGLTTEAMQNPDIFISAGWDFVGETANGYNQIWRLCNSGAEYPKLSWQYLPGDFICPDGVEMKDFAVLAGEWQLYKLSEDVAPDNGDGFVNFIDWAVFASQWQETKYIDDLAIFAEQWLQFGTWCADIAPDEGDGIVNLLDLALLTENWLEDTE